MGANTALTAARAELVAGTSAMSNQKKPRWLEVPPGSRKRRADTSLAPYETASQEDGLLVHEQFLARRTLVPRVGGFQHVARWVDSGVQLCWDFKKRGTCPRGALCRW